MMYRYVHNSKYTSSLDNSPIEYVFSGRCSAQDAIFDTVISEYSSFIEPTLFQILVYELFALNLLAVYITHPVMHIAHPILVSYHCALHFQPYEGVAAFPL